MGGIPNGWFIQGKSHLEMDDLGVPPFQETPIYFVSEILLGHHFAKTVLNYLSQLQTASCKTGNLELFFGL